MDRRQFIQTTAFGTAAVTAAQHGHAANGKPNFVFILCDDMGYGDLSCYGHPQIQTPALDRFAREGVRLTDCYCPQPVCSPARAGIMTGRNPFRCRIPDWIPPDSKVHLKREEVTIAKLLKDAGYVTALVGKWHLNGGMETGQPTPGDHGFDTWFATQNNAAPSHKNPNNFYRNGHPVGLIEGYSSGIIVNEAVSFLRKQTASRPFALFVCFHTPHEPIATGKSFIDLYRDEPDTNKAMYYGNVSEMDYETGRLINEIDKLGFHDNTLVQFTSDNGPETLDRYRGSQYSYGTPGSLRGMKLHMYEGGIRVPGIIRFPGRIKPNTQSDEPINGTDILPTFCELAEIKIPHDRAVDGASYTPVFKGRSIKRDRPLFWRYDNALSQPKLAMRKNQWKILADKNFQHVELYDLNHDRNETTNIASKNESLSKRMLNDMKKIHLEIVNDPISA